MRNDVHYHNRSSYITVKMYLELNNVSNSIPQYIDILYNDTIISKVGNYVVEVKCDDEHSIITYFQCYKNNSTDNYSLVSDDEWEEVLYKIDKTASLLYLMDKAIW